MNNIVKYPLLSPVDGSIIGGIVGGIGSMIGSGINARAQKKMNEQNIKAQRQENQLNREFTEDMYNKYESPVAQRQQMLEAGLNPMGAIAPQSVGSASTSALPPGQAPQFGSAIQEGIQAFFDAGSSILAQGLQKQEIKQKELENWRLAFENGNAEELYEAELKALEEQTAYTRAQKRAKNQEIKNLQFTYKKAKEAYEKGINEFVDDHNVKESQAAANNATATATTDANKRAEELHPLNKQLLEGQITVQDYSKDIIKNESDLSSLKTAVRTVLSVNYDNLPSWLQPYCLAAINLKREFDNFYETHDEKDWKSPIIRKGLQRQFNEALDEFKDNLQHFIDVSDYDYSYSNRKSEDAKSQISVDEAKWDREAGQRSFDNTIKVMALLNNYSNSAY